MDLRPLGNTGLDVTPIGFGAFKIGRNQQIKYPHAYDLPSDDEAAALIHGIRALGINYFDTAPAYGLSEARLGATLPDDGSCVISTKAGEQFENGRSRYDYAADAIRRSVEASLRRLRRDRLDLVFVHSDGRDVFIQQQTDTVAVLQDFRDRGLIRCLGFSGKTAEGLTLSLDWADAVMVEFNSQNTTLLAGIEQAHERGRGVVVKKALGSGHLPADESLRFVLGHGGVDTAVVGSLNLGHLRANVAAARSVEA
jgi:aryl-alcohol dehydrogenase-like predicted oxidoreductase